MQKLRSMGHGALRGRNWLPPSRTRENFAEFNGTWPLQQVVVVLNDPETAKLCSVIMVGSSQGLEYLSECGIALSKCFYAACELYHVLQCRLVEARRLVVSALALSRCQRSDLNSETGRPAIDVLTSSFERRAIVRLVASWSASREVIRVDLTVTSACDSSSADLICGVSVPTPGFCKTTMARNALNAAALCWHSSRAVLCVDESMVVSVFVRFLYFRQCF